MEKMNKLRQNLYSKKPWGSEVVWALTDGYMSKTIEIEAGKQSYAIVHEDKEKSIIVVSGDLYLTYGDCCLEDGVPVYKLPEGWSWYIEPGKLHKYAALDKSVRIIEVSTPLFEDGIVLSGEDLTAKDKKEIEATAKDMELQAMAKAASNKEKKTRKPRKKKAKASQTKKKTRTSEAKKKVGKEKKDDRNS